MMDQLYMLMAKCALSLYGGDDLVQKPSVLSPNGNMPFCDEDATL